MSTAILATHEIFQFQMEIIDDAAVFLDNKETTESKGFRLAEGDVPR